MLNAILFARESQVSQVLKLTFKLHENDLVIVDGLILPITSLNKRLFVRVHQFVVSAQKSSIKLDDITEFARNLVSCSFVSAIRFLEIERTKNYCQEASIENVFNAVHKFSKEYIEQYNSQAMEFLTMTNSAYFTSTCAVEKSGPKISDATLLNNPDVAKVFLLQQRILAQSVYLTWKEKSHVESPKTYIDIDDPSEFDRDEDSDVQLAFQTRPSCSSLESSV